MRGFAYDNNGNTLTKVVGSNTTSFAWDYENRLTSVTLPGSGGTVSFKYDPFGRRIYKSSSSATSVFAYDDDGNLIEETNSSGTAVARYSQGLNADEPLAMLRSSTTSYYDVDGLDSVTSLSNSAGALAQTYGYDSFGKQTSSSGSLTNPFEYTARELDPEISLYYYRARYYDPSVGRFIGEDQSGFTDGVDFYRYVRNDPINSTDPSGFTTFKGFTADQEVQLRNAVDEALKKLKDTCSGKSCAGADAPKIAQYLENGTFVLNKKASWCGHTGPASWAQWRHTYSLGLKAFGPTCCSLASTMVHEVVHGLTHISDKRGNEVEKDCFGCITPD